MVQIVAPKIYRTENLSIAGIDYTVRFAATADKSEFIMFVSNNSTGKETKYHFSDEVAESFQHWNGKKLENEVLAIIRDDINNRII